MKDALRKLCCLVSTICPLLAWAGFDEALKSYQARDYAAAARTEAASAADAGDARASLLLGVMVPGGQGGAADAEQAVAHFEKAARGGIVGAYSKLAQAYSRGAGWRKIATRRWATPARRRALAIRKARFFSVLLTNEVPELHERERQVGRHPLLSAGEATALGTLDRYRGTGCSVLVCGQRVFRWRSHARAESRGHDRGRQPGSAC